MPKTRPAYAPEHRARIIELARAGRTPEELAREFEPCSHTIRSWLRAADRGGLAPARIGGALDPDEREELRRLRREDEACRRLMTLPSVGPVVATALVAAVVDSR